MEKTREEPNATEFHQLAVWSPHGGNENMFTIPKRYTNLRFLSAGAQGTVVIADDLVTGERVAIKKMEEPFGMKMSAKRAYREFILLTTIKHPHIISLKNAFTPDTSVTKFHEVYLVMELMNYNLRQVVHQIKLDHKKLSFLVYQMLCAIKHLHNSGIIHRDLKPENIVVNENCELKVLDFGLARKMAVDTSTKMSEYVVTRYYRAPEVILGLPYSEKVDIWSVGCIFAEMINHVVLFPGQDRVDQWTKIYTVLGTPDDVFVKKLGRSTATYVRALKKVQPIPVEEILPYRSFLAETEIPEVYLTAVSARDLFFNMMKINPDERYSVEEALNHPYVRLWYKDSEVNAPASENRYDQGIDFADKSLHEWKRLIFEEVQKYQANHEIHEKF